MHLPLKLEQASVCWAAAMLPAWQDNIYELVLAHWPWHVSDSLGADKWSPGSRIKDLKIRRAQCLRTLRGHHGGTLTSLRVQGLSSRTDRNLWAQVGRVVGRVVKFTLLRRPDLSVLLVEFHAILMKVGMSVSGYY